MELQQDICIYDCFCLSHVRKKGRTVDNRMGRRNNGFLYVFSGGVSLRLDSGGVLWVNAGQLAFIPEGSRYQLVYEEQTHSCVINFRSFIPTDREQRLWKEPVLIPNTLGEERFQQIAVSLANTTTEQFKLKQVLYEMFDVLKSQGESGMEQDIRSKKIAAGVEMLKQNLRENIPAEALARACNMSVSAFRKLFVACYGEPPVQYRNRLRINHARLLLQNEEGMSVEEIAESVGFPNVSFFCRQYKKFTGQRPTQAR